jgi:hypothetical protein
MKKTMVIITIICVLFIVMASTCFADNVIYGCVGKFTGNLRVVGETSRCFPTESRISWNIQGPPGVANGITAAAYAYVISDGTFSPAIPPSEGFIGVAKREGDGNYGLVLDPAIFLLDGPQPRCIVNSTNFSVTCAQVGWEGAGAQINCFDANLVATDSSFSVICVQ